MRASLIADCIVTPELCSLALTACGILTMSALCGCNRSPAEAPQKAAPQITAVQVIRPHKGEIARSITLPANIRADQQATLYAKVAGYLKTISVDKGDQVRAGDLLADIEVPELIADQAKFKAEVEVAEVDYKRLSEAQKKAPDLITPQSVDNAKGKLDIARANLKRNETLLGYAKIVAPFSGVVTKRWVDRGALIPAATSSSAPQNAAVVTLMDFSKVRIEVAIPESEVPLVKKDLPVKTSVDELPGRTFEGKITRFAYALDDATKTMAAEIEMPNPDGQLRPGMFATVKIAIERKSDSLLIPVDCLVVEKIKTSVFLHDGGKAKKVAVKTGFTDGVSVELLEGLKPNDPIIVVGKLVLNDGQAVSVSEAAK